MEKTFESLIELYRKEKFLARLHIRIRYRRGLLAELLQYVPESGSILDIGCGHGVFANLLSLTSAKREITGIDISENKIAVAQRTIGNRKNINFFVADATKIVPRKKLDVITIMDTLYLIPFELQEKVLEVLSGYLETDGYLMINEVCRDSSFRFRRALLQETISVKLLGITAGKNFYFRSGQEWVSLLESIGFSVQAIKRRTPNPSQLFLCRK